MNELLSAEEMINGNKLIPMKVGRLERFKIHEVPYQRDSLEAGAIPNPHAKVGMPKLKLMRFILNNMFARGLPAGWGK